MDRKKLIEHFSRRMIKQMQEEGYESDRSGAGVDIKKLVKVTGCSYQMARRYVLGQALPELHIILKIASWLNTSPSWLLFGENDSKLPSNHKPGAIIEIEPDLLKYILKKSVTLLSITDNSETIINFIVDSVYDASHLNTDKKTVYKIIDMMITSATLLNNGSKENKKHAPV